MHLLRGAYQLSVSPLLSSPPPQPCSAHVWGDRLGMLPAHAPSAAQVQDSCECRSTCFPAASHAPFGRQTRSDDLQQVLFLIWVCVLGYGAFALHHTLHMPV
jgi:hypothetical protein